jgi:geranylgeranyl diphosphate synthase type II
MEASFVVVARHSSRSKSIPIAVNVGNATSLLALRRVMENRGIVGPATSWKIMEETERMMTHSVEGQAIELGWIRDNRCDLQVRDYMRMCPKKASRYSFIYPMRPGALVACSGHIKKDEFCQLGWYFGAAFQIQDGILNLTADYGQYGKEIAGDLWQGKRTPILIHAHKHCSSRERARLRNLLATPRPSRLRTDVDWVYDLFLATTASTMPGVRHATWQGRHCSRRWQRFAEYRTPKKSASSWR